MSVSQATREFDITKFIEPMKQANRLLPWMSARHNVFNGAYAFQTMVKQSTIKGAGFGRFAMEFIPKSSVIYKRRFIGVESPNEVFTTDKAIKMSSKDELDQLVLCYLKHSYNISKEETIASSEFESGLNNINGSECSDEVSKVTIEDIRDGLEGFLAEYDGNCVVLSQSDCVNTSLNPNLLCYTKDGYLYGEALQDIYPNNELFINYCRWNFPNYYFEFCREWEIKSIPEMLEDIGHIEAKAC